MSLTVPVRRSLLSTSFALRRALSTTPPNTAPSRLPLVFLTIGTASAAAYLYVAHAPAMPRQEKSPFDPQNFVDFKLKKILPYNHNTARSLLSPSFPAFY